MKIHVKTLNQKSLFVDIEDTKTVYELKMELSLYPDVGVKPELQKLVYAGNVLSNESSLSSCNIDAKKFLVVTVLKWPSEEPPVPTLSPLEGETTPKPVPKEEAESAPPSAPSMGEESANSEKMVAEIVGMGYEEQEVRRALVASFYNPERAIEYLIEGIPSTFSSPRGETYDDSEAANLTFSPSEVFRSDPLLRKLRHSLQQNPEVTNGILQRIGERNPDMLTLMDEHQREFLSMLVEDWNGDDDDNDDDDDDHNATK